MKFVWLKNAPKEGKARQKRSSNNASNCSKAELGGAGLRGQSAGSTALCTVGKTGTGLTYRGYDITDLANNAQFEEVAHLLLRGHLPNQQELDAYKTHLLSLRGLPTELKQALELIQQARTQWTSCVQVVLYWVT